MSALSLAASQPARFSRATTMVPGPCSVGSDRSEFARAVARPEGLARHRKGASIFICGEAAPRYYEVVSGVVSGYSELIDGRRQIIEFFLPGEIVGFSPTGRFPYSAEAVTEAVLRARPVPLRDRSRPADAEEVHRLFDSTLTLLQAAQDRLMLLGRKSARERVASFLLSMAARSGCTADKHVDLPMSRLEIADYLGLTIETVSRTISELRRDRIIAFAEGHRQVVLLDIEALREYAGDDDEID